MNRKRSAGLTVLLATDGSRQAHAALALAAAVPWPETSHAHIVLARGGIPFGPWPPDIRVAGISGVAERAVEREISRARRLVRHRWSDITVATPTTPPVEAIVVEAERRRAGVIVVGSRGLGYARRLMLGSVSRGVVRRASSPVLVVKGRRRRINRLVLATDGSLNARRALDFVLARLEPPAGARVNVLRVLEPVLPNTNLLPAGIRRAVLASAASLNASRTSQARREVEAAAVRLKRDGWRARGIVREGVPLAELLREVVASRADLLVVGARGTGGLARLLLGSVAEGALDRSPVPVVLVK